MVEVESKMDESLHHVKSRATLLSRCSYTYIVHLSLKELGIEPGSEASHLMKKTIQILDSKDPNNVLQQGKKQGLHDAFTLGMTWLDLRLKKSAQ